MSRYKKTNVGKIGYCDNKTLGIKGADGNIKNIPISQIKNIGSKKIKSRHKFFVGKYTKK